MARYGMTIPLDGVPLAQQRDWIRELADLGYTDLWSAEAGSTDGYTPLALASQWAPEARLGCAILPAYTRGPALLAMSAASLASAAPGRTVVGIGSSSNVIVEQWNGIAFRRPLAKVSTTVDYLRAVLAGERGPGGFKLASPPAAPVPIVLAALRERMLRLAGEVADGVFANFLPLSGVELVSKTFGRPEKELACRFFSIHGAEDEAFALAKRTFVAYATVPVYSEFFRWLGHAEQIDPVVEAWNAGDRRLAVELAPEGLIRETFLLGPVEAQRERLAEFAAAGIQTGVLAISCPPTEVPRVIDEFSP